MPGSKADRPGAAGEARACEHLRRQGFEVLARNYRSRAGEIDIVARDGSTLVFVEVKERGGVSHGHAFEAVTLAKRRRIVRAARVFAASRGLTESAIRFDVIAIEPSAAGSPSLRHDRGAFDVDGN